MNDLRKSIYLGLSLAIKLIAGLVTVKLAAQALGPSEFGLAGQVSSLVAIVTLLAGGGISAGMTKVYADESFENHTKSSWLAAAKWIALTVSLILGVVFLCLSSWIEKFVLQGASASAAVQVALLLAILPIAFSGIGQGRINGRRRNDVYAVSMVVGSIVGLGGFFMLSHFYGGTGAMVGLIWVQAAQAFSFILFSGLVDRQQEKTSAPLEIQKKIRFFMGYGMTSMAAGIIIPVVYLVLRPVVEQFNSAEALGLWQASLRISEAYTQLPMLMLSVVFFARFATSAGTRLSVPEVAKVYLFITGLMLAISAFVYATRHYWIELVFTSKFIGMEPFVGWQLAGDCLRMLSYVGTTILAARGAIRLCLAGEVMQGILLALCSYFFVPRFGIYGPFYSYLGVYLVYFLLTLLALYASSRKISNK
jgi:antigen flippase